MPLHPYVLNQHARLMLSITTPVRGAELQTRSLAFNEAGGFWTGLRRLLDANLLASLRLLLEAEDPSGCDLPAEHIQWLAEMGILLPAAQLPQMPAFEPELADSPSQAEPLAELAANPGLAIQTEAVPPAALAAQLPGWEQFSPRRPLLWLRQPVSQIWLPCWLSPEQLERMMRGSAPDAAETAALAEAGILIPADRLAWLGPQRPALVAGLRQQVQEQGFFQLKQVLPPLHLRALRAYLRNLASEGFFQRGDPMVPERDVIHNQPLMRYLHLQLTPFLQEVLGEPLKASYAFLASYKEGSVLRRHTDRPQCDWNLSLVLDMQPQGREPWPFYLDGPAGLARIELAIGDLVFYSGVRNPHWRDELPAGQVVSVGLFHFVSASFSGTLL